jgi:hypothetical protein
MTIFPVVVRTCHFHARPRLSNTTSKIGNSSGIASESYRVSSPKSGKKMPVGNHQPALFSAKSI